MKQHKFSNKRSLRKNHQYRDLKRNIQILQHHVTTCAVMIDKIHESIEYIHMRFSEIDHDIEKLRKLIFSRFSPTVFIIGFVIGWIIIEVISHAL